MLRRDPPMWSAFDLTLVPPLRNRLIPYDKYILSGATIDDHLAQFNMQMRLDRDNGW